MSGHTLRNGRNYSQRRPLASPTKDDKENIHPKPDDTEAFSPEESPNKKNKTRTTKAEPHSF
jgi:hypothetical protein